MSSGGTPKPPPDLERAMKQIAQFAEAWAAQITESFKPFTACVNRWAEKVREERLGTQR